MSVSHFTDKTVEGTHYLATRTSPFILKVKGQGHKANKVGKGKQLYRVLPLPITKHSNHNPKARLYWLQTDRQISQNANRLSIFSASTWQTIKHICPAHRSWHKFMFVWEQDVLPLVNRLFTMAALFYSSVDFTDASHWCVHRCIELSTDERNKTTPWWINHTTWHLF